MTTETFLDAVADALVAAGRYNRNDQVAPAAVLWPDEARQWLSLLPPLRQRLPLLTLGDYDPGARTGPAYWIRCMIARTLPEDRLPEGEVPIIYLPGYGKGDLRAIEDCPRPLQPLAELQYRGTLWVHPNGRDWLVTGFLATLDAPVAADRATREALARALPLLAREPVERLRREAPLRQEFFDGLLHPDPVRQMLLWLDAPDRYRAGLTAEQWRAFTSLSRRKFGVDPEQDGPLTAGQRLGEPAGEWLAVWDRYCEAPATYPGLPDLLRRARPVTQLKLFDGGPRPYWPQDNEAAEAELRGALNALRPLAASEARAKLAQLEASHGRRRNWVWAGLGRAPLAVALEHLSAVARLTLQPLAGATPVEIARAYTDWGWQADAALLRALAAVEDSADAAAVNSAIRSLYRPWLEAAALRFQDAVLSNPADYTPGPVNVEPGTCVLFCDALRYDVAQLLGEALQGRGVECAAAWRFAALPPVTATAKPAVSPAAPAVRGGAPGLTPVAAATGTPLGTESLRRLIEEASYQVLRGGETGDPGGRGWTEAGAIDAQGHERGAKLAGHLAGETRALAERVAALLDAGWRQVVVVTDHGWLLLPEGLPKAELPLHQTVTRKGRCAVVKPGATTDERTVPWHWDSGTRIAVARGIHCYEAGKEYEHGGLSPQECVVPVLTVRAPAPVPGAAAIGALRWQRLRGHVQLMGDTSGATVDLRGKPGDAASSLIGGPRAVAADGTASFLVEDEEAEGQAAVVVALRGAIILAQRATLIGGD